MNNTYVANLLHWGLGPRLVFANKVLRRLRSSWRVRHSISVTREMCTIEQRINLFHLTEQVCAYHVAGAVVELGCYVGETAIVMAKVLDEYQRSHELHLFDAFAMSFATTASVRPQLEENFRTVGLPRPNVHAGDFATTVPAQLPESIALCHIDCGFGGAPEAHRDVVLHLLEQVYPRLTAGGIVVLMDYCVPGSGVGWNGNPGVKLACDRFFADKPEKVSVLWAGDGSQGYVRKL